MPFTNTSFMQTSFPTDYKSIIERLENINAIKYASSRNFIDGAVTYLSSYISRGVISLPQVMAQVLKNYSFNEAEKIIQELAWRQYWQRAWQHLGDAIFTDIKQPQQDVAHQKMVSAIENAQTGIEIIDQHIERLYATGYMHNHLRMYISSLACNVGKAHWLQPSQWMYYHLLDGDLASNALSWQWGAGSFSSKKYYCNQENINRYTRSEQRGSFLDQSYEAIAAMKIPNTLQAQHNFSAETELPKTGSPVLINGLPILIYNSYNLDPSWHAGESANRILLLEPTHFKHHPVSNRVMEFIIELSKNIAGIQIFCGDFSALQALSGSSKIYFKTHPTALHYQGVEEKYDELFPEVTGYYPSFFAYWKKCAKYLQ